MAAQATTTYVASFELTLENTENANDTTKRTISFDVPSNTDESKIIPTANLFAASSVNTVFQPTNWRDYGGNWDVYKITNIQPGLTEKTVVKYDEIIPA